MQLILDSRMCKTGLVVGKDDNRLLATGHFGPQIMVPRLEVDDLTCS